MSKIPGQLVIMACILLASKLSTAQGSNRTELKLSKILKFAAYKYTSEDLQ